jgi:hypothetical protein
MLLHLPIVILSGLSPVAFSDQVPKYDIAGECNHEGGGGAAVDRCSQDEAVALKQLKARWKQFNAVNKQACVGESSGDGVSSYVELLTCLEMSDDVEKEDATVGTGHDPIRPGAIR